MKLVRAKRTGIWQSHRRRAGSMFEIDDSVEVPVWAELASAPTPAPKPKKSNPRTLSEINRRQHPGESATDRDNINFDLS